MGVVNTGGCGLFGRTGSNLLPTALFQDLHFMHSSKYTTFLLLQLVCFGVGKDL